MSFPYVVFQRPPSYYGEGGRNGNESLSPESALLTIMLYCLSRER